jgi:hypothetical protein
MSNLAVPVKRQSPIRPIPKEFWGISPGLWGLEMPFTSGMNSTTSTEAPQTTGSAIDIPEIAAATKRNRNRAVDLYRVAAMLMVAIGHWIALVAVTDGGEMVTGNALAFQPNLAWITWLVQVMPLFFVVGGFASAMSLDSHVRSGGRSQDWIAARLRRMLPPAVVLAATWLVVIAAGAAAGQLDLVLAGAGAAAIPLWFLANYTIDTALAPFVLPRFRKNPAAFAAGVAATFLVVEIARIAGMHYVTEINWVLGWLSFQILGMAWRDGLLPTGRKLAALAAASWAAALGLVLSGGPWSVAMVHFPGVEHSPTHPPTLSLMAFGAAYSLTAILAAPAISKFLAERPRLWSGVIAGNAVAMSVYLWHMTAAIVVVAITHATIGLPEVAVGSLAWWGLKVPMVIAAIAVLLPIVKTVSPVERRALLAPRRPWNGNVVSVIAIAAVTSTALKLWTIGNSTGLVIGSVVVVVLGNTVLQATSVSDVDDERAEPTGVSQLLGSYSCETRPGLENELVK